MNNFKKNLLKFRPHFAIELADIVLITLAWAGAYALRLNLLHASSLFVQSMLLSLPMVLVAQLIANYYFGVHRGSWRFSSMNDLTRIIKAAAVGFLLSIVILFINSESMTTPRSIPFIYAGLLILFLGAPRFLYRHLKEQTPTSYDQKRVLIIGAGSAGEGLVRDLLRSKISGYLPVGLVDDDPAKIGREIHGVRVYGNLATLQQQALSLNVELIIIAMPSANAQQMQHIVALCEQTGLAFRRVPSIDDLASGRVSLDTLQHVSIEDLLGREQVNLDWEHIATDIRGKVILVSGGAGSIGSELSRQIASFSPENLIILDNNEFNLYSIDMELAAQPTLRYIPLLQDVTDRDGIKTIMQKYQPDIVFHAAAYKHVPLLEEQIRTAIRNNVLGTQVLAEEAAAIGTQKFIMVSTDKAVRPTNIMGATKRMAEIFCQNYNRFSSMQFITVRFGNVLGSTGSVVPLFKKQLAMGGPITVTHPEVTRYFMTIKEASQLILQATVLGSGGEIFVLDMGQPLRIQYLAEQIIQLAGLKIGQDIEITYTGLRPGEKLHEELFHDRETLLPTLHEKIFLARATDVDWDDLQLELKAIVHGCQTVNNESLERILKKLVPEYNKNSLDYSRVC